MSVNSSLDLPCNIALVHEWFTPRSTGGAENVVQIIDDLLTEIASQPELFSLVNEKRLKKNLGGRISEKLVFLGLKMQ